MEVSIISTELIKPSTQTPDHLKHYRFSSFDQIIVHSFIPMIFYYKTETIIPLNMLKKSLSETLTRFYPLAGRVKKDDLILCNDEGAPFLVAHVNSTLSSLLQHPETSELDKLVPLKHDSATDLVAALQINLFSCGGVSVGFGMSHKLGDGHSMLMFLNTWALISRRETRIATPLFNSFDLFPPKNMSGLDPERIVSKEKVVTKRYVFDSSTLLALQNKYAENGKPISRVMALSAFIWRKYMETVETVKLNNVDIDKIYIVLHSINLRPKMGNPDAMNLFGNIFGAAVAVPRMDSNDENYEIVRSMREALRNVDAEFVKKNQTVNTQQLDLMKHGDGEVEICTFGFSSFSKFPIYEVDLGWGKPVWFSFAGWIYKNAVMLYDSREGGGLEAWVNLTEQDMAKFAKDQELLAYASPPLNI